MAGPGGVKEIMKCSCGALEAFEQWHYTSFGGFTDGKPNSMLPKGEMPYMARCQTCGEYNIPHKLESVGKVTQWPSPNEPEKPVPEAWKNAPKFRQVPDDEMVAAARDLAARYPEETFNLYVTALHVVNNPRRISEKQTFKEGDIREMIRTRAFELSTTTQASPLENWLQAEAAVAGEEKVPAIQEDVRDMVEKVVELGRKDERYKWLAAEFLRETGRFEECLELLAGDKKFKFIADLAMAHKKAVYQFV